MQVIKAQNGMDVNLFSRDTGSMPGRSVFLVCFSTYFTNQNIDLKVGMLSKLLKVIV